MSSEAIKIQLGEAFGRGKVIPDYLVQTPLYLWHKLAFTYNPAQITNLQKLLDTLQQKQDQLEAIAASLDESQISDLVSIALKIEALSTGRYGESEVIITPGDSPFSMHLSNVAQCKFNALSELQGKVAAAKKAANGECGTYILTEDDILQTRATICGETRAETASSHKDKKYRKTKAFIADPSVGEASNAILLITPFETLVEGCVRDYLEWISGPVAAELPKPIRAILNDYLFLAIHPFPDGNTKQARVIYRASLSNFGIDPRNLVSSGQTLTFPEMHTTYTSMKRWIMSEDGPELAYWVENMLERLIVAFDRTVERAEKMRDLGVVGAWSAERKELASIEKKLGISM